MRAKRTGFAGSQGGRERSENENWGERVTLEGGVGAKRLLRT